MKSGKMPSSEQTPHHADLGPHPWSPLPLGISQINHSGDDKNTLLDGSGLGTAFLSGFGSHLCF